MPADDRYTHLLALARRVAWAAPTAAALASSLDPTRRWLPEALARTSSLAFLDAGERLALDHLRAAAHLALFAQLELQLVAQLVDDAPGLRAHAALIEIARDERKHAALFVQVAKTIHDQVGLAQPIVVPPVPAGPPLARAIAMLHLDTLAQVHHLECVRAGDELDACVAELMRLHWIEEVQHALVDRHVIDELAVATSDRDAAVEAYLDWADRLESCLRRQVDHDLFALARVTGRVLGERERERAVAVQHQAYRATFVGSAISHPAVIAVVAELSPSRVARHAARIAASL
jgi:predicted metal-dependent hydrolase